MTTRLTQKNNLDKAILSAFSYIKKVQKNIVPNMEYIYSLKPIQRKIYLQRLLKTNSKLLAEMYDPINQAVLNSFNIGNSGYNKFYSRFGSMPEAVVWKTLPKTDPFKITNRYLKKAAIVKKGLVNANDLNKIIKTGVKKGWDYQRTGREIEFKLGYRNKKTGELLKGLPKNGIHYQTSTIARQETRRANGISQFDQYSEARDNGINTRMRMVARLIATSREQSAVMNGQLDGEPYGSNGLGTFNKEKAGMFQYPDRSYYKFSEAPIQWSINDREYTIPIIVGGVSEEVAENQVQKQNEKEKKLKSEKNT